MELSSHRARFLVVFAVAVFLGSGASVIGADDPVLARAKRAERTGDLKVAIATYGEYLRTHPEADVTRMHQGLCMFWDGQTQQGIDVMTELIARNPKNPLPYAHRGNMLVREQRFDEAIADATRSYELSPPKDRPAALACLIRLYARNKQEKKALEIADSWLAANRACSSLVPEAKAFALSEMGNVAEADRWYQIADDKDCSNLVRLERVQMLARHDELRAKQMLDALSTKLLADRREGHPAADFAQTMTAIFPLEMQRKNWTQARLIAQAMVVESKQSTKWLLNQAEVARCEGQASTAIGMIQQIPDYERNQAAMRICMLGYRDIKRRKQATKAGEAYLALAPNDPHAAMEFATVLLDVGASAAEAKEVLLSTYEQGRGDEDYLKILAAVSAESLDFDLALKTYSRLIELQPKADDFYVARAAILCQLKRYREALADCNRAIALPPNLGREYRLRANVHEGLHDIRSALVDYAAAIKYATADDKHLAFAQRAVLLGKHGMWLRSHKDCFDAIRQPRSDVFSFQAYSDINREIGTDVRSAAAADEAFTRELEKVQSIDN